MAKLIYVLNVSLDGYIADEDGKFDWAGPRAPAFLRSVRFIRG
jgi:dihydrofolate reductase